MRWLLALWTVALCLAASVPPALAAGPVAIAAAPDGSAPVSVPTEEDRPNVLSHILEEQAGPGRVAIKAAEPVRDRTAPSGGPSDSKTCLLILLTVTAAAGAAASYHQYLFGRPSHRVGRPYLLHDRKETCMKHKRIIPALTLALALSLLCCVPALAASNGDVAGAVEQTWTDAASQIKDVVDTVVFPALSMVLAIAFFAKLALAYFDYRKHGQFEWTGPVILFVCLVFVLLAPNYIWGIIGI